MLSKFNQKNEYSLIANFVADIITIDYLVEKIQEEDFNVGDDIQLWIEEHMTTWCGFELIAGIYEDDEFEKKMTEVKNYFSSSSQ